MFGNYQRPKANQPAQLGSLDAMAREASRRWDGASIGSVRVRNADDAAAVVEIRRASSQQVALQPEPIYFDGVTGQVLAQVQSKPVLRVQRFSSGMHFAQFDHWPLRWLYFLGGLSGCVLIVTGFLFWLESRRVQHARQGLSGVRVVEVLTIGSVTGIVLATCAFFVANRALPAVEQAGEGLAWGIPRERLELWVFYLVWLAGFGHAALRARRAWSEQCWGIALLALTAVLLNWLTTGDHVWHALGRGVPSVAGVDLVLLAGALCAAAVARRLHRTLLAAAGRSRQRASLAGHAKSLVQGCAVLLAGALVLTYLGFASLALRQAPHFAAVSAASRRAAPPAALSQRLLYRGSAWLLLGAALSFWAEGPSFGSLVWVLLLGGAGVAVTFTLTWRPRWLRWLVPRSLSPAGAGVAPHTAGWRQRRTR